MNYSIQLLEQAKHLSRKEPRRPRQASLRRAVSAAYYALFHLFTEEGARVVTARTELHPVLRRVFEHRRMKKICRAVSSGRLPEPWNELYDDLSAGQKATLREIAQTFVDLQEERHSADYAFGDRFARSNVRDLLDKAERTVRTWKTFRKTDKRAAEWFLLALLFGDRTRP